MSEQRNDPFKLWRSRMNKIFIQSSIESSNKDKHEISTIAPSPQNDEDCIKCESWRNDLFKTSPIVIFMAEKLVESGYNFNKNSIKCLPCDQERTGGFSPDRGIDLCYNKIPSKKIMEDTLAHEMIHAYDHVNFQVDWFNLEHHACSEIRAASLSGDCRFVREFLRGQFGFIKHHQACVKRRAILSVMSNPNCSSKREAELAVNKVFKSCFTDTQPFDEIY
ncbi:Mitochondrial inner membrane protease ATP23 [Smittium culicis]|uniref:Mitochondrial inner membrane protease ATP23 n=2 Tax=Smittium culicis TaxID=133412 RepID=A0A1R1WYG7_9FUNG|nr:Mitochondrial inner membrane protease ATP23 [Smittium culicis]